MKKYLILILMILVCGVVYAEDTPTPEDTEIPEPTETITPDWTHTASPTITSTFTFTRTPTITLTATITMTPTATPDYYYIYMLNATIEMNLWGTTPNYVVHKRIKLNDKHFIIRFIDPEASPADAMSALQLMQPQELILLEKPPAVYQSEYWKRLFE